VVREVGYNLNHFGGLDDTLHHHLYHRLGSRRYHWHFVGTATPQPAARNDQQTQGVGVAKKKKAITVSYKASKQRNPYAASAWNRSGSGRHPDKKKKNNRLACRGKVQQ
jgi:hypothetical protein